jgi:ribosomal protein L37AE/L43A
MKKINLDSLIVHGICPGCKEVTSLVSIRDNIYKCTSCGDELKQHVNGVIKYLPIHSKIKQLIYGKKNK